MDTKVSDINKIDIIAPILRKACNSYGLSCSYCKQGSPHPLPQDLGWSSEDWDITKAKAREQSKSLIDFNDTKPPTNMEQTMGIEEVVFSKLQIEQSNLREEPLEVMKSLIPPPPVTEAPEEVTEITKREDPLEAMKRLQGEGEKYELYDRIYVDQLSDKEESDTDTDGLTYTYFG